MMKNEKKVLTTEQRIRRRNFISFTTFFGINCMAYGAWNWLLNSPKEPATATARASKPLRKALNQTELFFRRFFSNNHLAKTYPVSEAAKAVKVNGNIGLKTALDVTFWKLEVKRSNRGSIFLDLDQIKSLPKTEIVFEFKCVEGWSQIQHWGGVKFADFIAHFKLLKESQSAYAGFETPDKSYFVGLDMESALHPQTILAYEMNGQPLLVGHGAPLRLIVPVKYGIKNLKRVGSIVFSDQRPRDYWALQGYDYYSGL